MIAAEWEPTFTGYEGKLNVKVDEYKYLIGLPDCGEMQMWDVYHDPQVTITFIVIESQLFTQMFCLF